MWVNMGLYRARAKSQSRKLKYPRLPHRSPYVSLGGSSWELEFVQMRVAFRGTGVVKTLKCGKGAYRERGRGKFVRTLALMRWGSEGVGWGEGGN